MRALGKLKSPYDVDDFDNKVFVRVTKNRYMHKDEIVSQTKAKLLKRMSDGSLSDFICDAEYDIIDMDLDKYEAGVYQLITTDRSYDIESGIMDGWTLALREVE